VRSDGSTFESNIDRIAAERDFYSDPTDTLLDDEITRQEGKFATLINSCREPGANDIDEQLVRALVYHLLIRAKSVRMWMSNELQHALDAMIGRLADPIFAEAGLNDYLNPRSVKLMECIQRSTEKSGVHLNRNQRAVAAMQLCAKALRKRRDWTKQFIELVKTSAQGLELNVLDSADRAHRASVSKTLGFGPHLEILKVMPFCVIDTPEDELFVLGDSPVFYIDSLGSIAHLSQIDPLTGHVCLPISSRRAIVLGNSESIPSAADINRASAQASAKMFMHAGPATSHLTLAKYIGQFVLPLPDIDWSRFEERVRR
jgi:hypothetical protein